MNHLFCVLTLCITSLCSFLLEFFFSNSIHSVLAFPLFSVSKRLESCGILTRTLGGLTAMGDKPLGGSLSMWDMCVCLTFDKSVCVALDSTRCSLHLWCVCVFQAPALESSCVYLSGSCTRVRSLPGHLPLQIQGKSPFTLLTLISFPYMFMSSKNHFWAGHDGTHF